MKASILSRLCLFSEHQVKRSKETDNEVICPQNALVRHCFKP